MWNWELPSWQLHEALRPSVDYRSYTDKGDRRTDQYDRESFGFTALVNHDGWRIRAYYFTVHIQACMQVLNYPTRQTSRHSFLPNTRS